MISEDYEDCWNNGNYEDQDCSQCPYSLECSGNEANDIDD